MVVPYRHGAHHEVFLCLLDRFLEAQVLGVAEQTYAYLLVFVALHVAANIGAWITRQDAALPAVMLSTEESELLLTYFARGH